MVQSTVYVNPISGKDTGVGSSSAPFKTLTKALKLAQAGTTIYLGNGTFNTASGEVFPLAIPGGVRVIGNEASKGQGIVIEGSGVYLSPTFSSQNITLRLETNAQLRGVTVTNRASKGTGIWIESTSPVIANNTLTGCDREGVFVTGTGKPAILDNVFTENAASGLFLARNAKGEVRRNSFQKAGYGIAISDQAAPLVSDNKVFANNTGIVLSRQARPVLRRNLIEKNTVAGMVVNEEARPELGSRQDPANNILRDNGQVDLKNATTFRFVSAGNQINPARVQGAVEFVVAEFTASSPVLGPAQFNDVAGHWAEAYIQRLVSRGLISGFPDGTFRPEANMTRAEYAAVIAKAFDLPPRGGQTGIFKDVRTDFWAAPAIQKASRMGFISGFPDNTFRPAQNLTRVQAIASIVSGLGLTGGNPTLLSAYSDRAQIPSYGTNPVATATQKGLVVNYPDPNRLEPMRDITRAEVATLIAQALVTIGKEKAIASPYLVKADPLLPSFSDIQGHWAADFIKILGNKDLLSGFADGTFKPDELLNRAQYAALLVKAFNPTPIRPPTQFKDVAADFWAFPVIQQAYTGGFLTGFPDLTFAPSQNVLRLQLIVSLVNGLSLPPGDVKALDRYQDRNTIPDYAKPAVAAAIQRGIVFQDAQQGQLNPEREATRAEAVAIIYQALVSSGRINYPAHE